MGRKILGVILGLIAGLAAIALVETVGRRIYPLPENLNFADREAVTAALSAVPAGAQLWVALAWLIGTFAGTFTAMKVARDPSERWPAFIVEAVLLGAGALNLAAVPHPLWFWVAGLVSFPLGTFAGIRLARS